MRILSRLLLVSLILTASHSHSDPILVELETKDGKSEKGWKFLKAEAPRPGEKYGYLVVGGTLRTKKIPVPAKDFEDVAAGMTALQNPESQWLVRQTSSIMLQSYDLGHVLGRASAEGPKFRLDSEGVLRTIGFEAQHQSADGRWQTSQLVLEPGELKSKLGSVDALDDERYVFFRGPRSKPYLTPGKLLGTRGEDAYLQMVDGEDDLKTTTVVKVPISSVVFGKPRKISDTYQDSHPEEVFMVGKMFYEDLPNVVVELSDSANKDLLIQKVQSQFRVDKIERNEEAEQLRNSLEHSKIKVAVHDWPKVKRGSDSSQRARKVEGRLEKKKDGSYVLAYPSGWGTTIRVPLSPIDVERLARAQQEPYLVKPYLPSPGTNDFPYIRNDFNPSYGTPQAFSNQIRMDVVTNESWGGNPGGRHIRHTAVDWDGDTYLLQQVIPADTNPNLRKPHYWLEIDGTRVRVHLIDIREGKAIVALREDVEDYLKKPEKGGPLRYLEVPSRALNYSEWNHYSANLDDESPANRRILIGADRSEVERHLPRAKGIQVHFVELPNSAKPKSEIGIAETVTASWLETRNECGMSELNP